MPEIQIPTSNKTADWTATTHKKGLTRSTQKPRLISHDDKNGTRLDITVKIAKFNALLPMPKTVCNHILCL